MNVLNWSSDTFLNSYIFYSFPFKGDSPADTEDYDDAQDQNTNLCPQFSNPDDPGK